MSIHEITTLRGEGRLPGFMPDAGDEPPMLGGETYERVRSELTSLRGRYGGCPVRQTTVPVSSRTYEQVRSLAERSVVDAGVRVRNARGESLAVPSGGGWGDPWGHVEDAEPIEDGACRVLRETADVGCDIQGLLGITILCFTDAGDDGQEPVYRLGALFDGGRVTDPDCGDCQWRPGTGGPFVEAY